MVTTKKNLHGFVETYKDAVDEALRHGLKPSLAMANPTSEEIIKNEFDIAGKEIAERNDFVGHSLAFSGILLGMTSMLPQVSSLDIDALCFCASLVVCGTGLHYLLEWEQHSFGKPSIYEPDAPEYKSAYIRAEKKIQKMLPTNMIR